MSDAGPPQVFSVFLVPLFQAAVDPTIGPPLFSLYVVSNRRIPCLMCNEVCGPAHRFAPYVVAAVNEDPDGFCFISVLCRECAGDGEPGAELQGKVYMAIKTKLMPDAIIVPQTSRNLQ